METEQISQNEAVAQQAQMTQEQILQEILENTRKTRNYIKWQLYITVALVVLPLLAMVVMLPMVMRSLGTLGGIYGPGGMLAQ